MDPLEKTIALIKASPIPVMRIAADNNIGLTTLYAILNGESDPGYSKVVKLYRYVSGRTLEV